ncbi:hypothetical protein FIBSPDRAFT_1050906 [Athelia psychrophila]|uniref:Uncharacterized protein n=1 Tax=Athelia psychrophila TaxID=1759441 RepID=A0A166A2M4_9AGAM|nr:hypothetical protein FIBSPDRAFT_1050906 [Fibularhizoctonia sp. CBS 109695]
MAQRTPAALPQHALPGPPSPLYARSAARIGCYLHLPASPTPETHPIVHNGRSYVRTPSSTQASPPAGYALPSWAGALFCAHPDPPTSLSSAYADIRICAA